MAETTDDRLRLLIERVERLEEEKKGIGDDIKDVYLEAKAVGYDVKIMRQCVKLRKMSPDDRREQEAILDLYKAALGLDFGSTPLGRVLARDGGSDRCAAPDPDGSPAADTPAGRDLYPEALRLVTEHDNASISWLQRQLRIGFNSAALLVTRLEAEGVVSPPNHVGRREILRPVETAH